MTSLLADGALSDSAVTSLLSDGPVKPSAGEWGAGWRSWGALGWRSWGALGWRS